MKTTAVFLDLDGTLVDLKYASEQGLINVRERFELLKSIPLEELELKHKDLLEVYHIMALRGEMSLEDSRVERFRQLIKSYGGAGNDEDAREAAAIYRHHYVESERAIPGTIELLNELRSQGVLIGVITNNSTEEQLRKVNKCGFAPLIHSLIISEQVGIAKPDRRIFDMSLKSLDCNPEESVMIGDAWETDMLGAFAAGIRRLVWMNNFGHKCPDPTIAFEITSFKPMKYILELIHYGKLNEISFR